MITFTIPNLAQALRSIDTYSKKMQQEVDDEMSKTAYDIVNEAQNLAPVDDGNLRANIRVVKDEPLGQKLIESGAEYSAYVEFGTGTNVDVPNIEGIQQFAMQFKGEGKQGTHPVKFKDGTWAMVPYQLNLRPHPFFFPAIQHQALDLPKKLKDILEGK